MFWEPTKQERKRRRVLGVVCVGIALWSCAETDAYLGDIPNGPPLTSPDASAGGDVDASLLMCVATECPEGLTTCPSEFGPTYKCSVDLRRDQDHCGSCGHACITMEPLHMTSRCVEGGCELECLSPPRFVPPEHFFPTSFQNCNGLLDDGCEIDVFSDPKNCGTCGNACADGQACVDGQCGCPNGLEYCNGFCLDFSDDDANCGACNAECVDPDPACDPMPANTGYGCLGKACEKLKCQFGFDDCDKDLGVGCSSNGCETPVIDVANCGACGNACKPDEDCSLTNSGFQCVPSCAKQGLTACGSFCADTLNDPNHCGGCLLLCPPAEPQQTSSCKKGICEVVCAEGFGDCNGDPADGCETDLRVHPQHCGACGVSCDLALGQPCVEGKCLLGPCEGQEAR